jgi:hypothetical protein
VADRRSIVVLMIAEFLYRSTNGLTVIDGQPDRPEADLIFIYYIVVRFRYARWIRTCREAIEHCVN